MEVLYENLLLLTWQQVVMWGIGGLLIYLAVAKDMEPTLLLPMGFGAILVNLPMSGAITQIHNGLEEIGVIDLLFESGIANELFFYYQQFPDAVKLRKNKIVFSGNGIRLNPYLQKYCKQLFGKIYTFRAYRLYHLCKAGFTRRKHCLCQW